jgi:hypothetical protein
MNRHRRWLGNAAIVLVGATCFLAPLLILDLVAGGH